MVRLRVREIAEAQDLNMNRLALKSGISYSTIVDLWYDRTRRLDKETLSKLCQALGVTPGDLLVWEPEEQPQIAYSPALAAA